MYKYILIVDDQIIASSNFKLEINREYDIAYAMYKDKPLPSQKPSIWKLEKE